MHIPRPAPAASTPDRLLDAAERLFAQRGYRGTSVREITASAGSNVASVTYHFRGKEGLYHEMFLRRLRALSERRVDSIRGAMIGARGGEAVERVLRAFARAWLQPLDDEGGQHLVDLMSRELAEPHLPPDLFAREMLEPVEDALSGALRRLDPRLDDTAARRCAHAFVAQLVHITNLRRHLGRRRGRQEGSNLFDQEAMTEHAIRFSVAGVQACAGGRR